MQQHMTMQQHMVVCTFRSGTDMREVFAVVEEERAAVASLAEQGRIGSIHLAIGRGTVFIETFAAGPDEAAATIRTLPMSAWWDIDVFPISAAPEAVGA